MSKTSKDEIERIYQEIRPTIEKRIQEFEEVWDEGDERVFDEMVFCLFTPQSKAKVCWDTVQDLKEDDLLLEGQQDTISDEIKRVRFRNNKAGYLVEARSKFIEDDKFIKEKISEFEDQKKARGWIVDNVKGLGYKEASHFLRNIGKGENLAILDRHILRNLVKLGVIDEIPKTLTKKRYLDIEKKMKEFAEEIGIPLGHLDLVLWYKETGEVFK